MTPTLPPNAARCPATRVGHCHQQAGCARAQAAHELGRNVHDFTREDDWTPTACSGYLRAADYIRVPTPAAPTIHDTPRGLT